MVRRGTECTRRPYVCFGQFDGKYEGQVVYSSIANACVEPEFVQGLESEDVGDFVDAVFDGDDDEHVAVVSACTAAVATSLVDNEDRDGASPFKDRVTGS
jgi:hypothetical protein